mmetsp:Transcript_65623/g.181190  ORF Transcript_65623/g.181190 Transcript_65623/m.181190 type:complete len:224 (+) Transcript_65623:195-866(+)
MFSAPRASCRPPSRAPALCTRRARGSRPSGASSALANRQVVSSPTWASAGTTSALRQRRRASPATSAPPSPAMRPWRRRASCSRFGTGLLCTRMGVRTRPPWPDRRRHPRQPPTPPMRRSRLTPTTWPAPGPWAATVTPAAPPPSSSRAARRLWPIPGRRSAARPGRPRPPGGGTRSPPRPSGAGPRPRTPRRRGPGSSPTPSAWPPWRRPRRSRRARRSSRC